MSIAAMNPFMGELIQTAVPGVNCAWLQEADFQISPLAASNTAINAGLNLGAATQAITTGLTNPDVVRNVTVKGNVAGITGNVTVKGTDYLGVSINEIIALNGTTVVAGNKAFLSVTEVDLPVQTHTPTQEVATATVAGSVTGSGNATITVTAAGLAGSPKAYSVAVLNGDSASVVAGKIQAVLAADSALTALYTVTNPGGAPTTVVLTSVTPQANDTTLNVAIANGTCTGLTAAPTSTITTAGVPYDTVSVGTGSKLGLPYTFSKNMVRTAYNNNVQESTPPTVNYDANNICNNTVTLASTLAGNPLDIIVLIPG